MRYAMRLGMAVAVLAGAVLAAGCGGGGSAASEAVVVGVESAGVFDKADKGKEIGRIPAGTPVRVLKVEELMVNIATESGIRLTATNRRRSRLAVAPGSKIVLVSGIIGQVPNQPPEKSPGKVSGWVYRCHLCPAAEFDKRKAAGTVPKMTICLASEGDGFAMYGGAIPIRNNAPSLEEGMGIYCDKTMTGKSFGLESTQVTHKPDVPYFVGKNSAILELKILPLAYAVRQ